MIESIVLKNFRNHKEVKVDFSPTTNLIYGPNGAGKTSILEAIYCTYRGSSFKGSDREAVRDNTEWFTIELHDDEGMRRLTYDLRNERASKKFTVDDKEYARLPPKFKRPIVLFSPDDLLLLTGSPTRRRRYIDTMIAQINPQYATILSKYERALVQRNKLLKSSACTPDALFSWNVLLSEYGATIINERRSAVAYLNERATQYYCLISDDKSLIEITYTHALVTAHQLFSALETNYERDRLLGVTTVGPHRHDIVISMNGKRAVDIASRGENRTIVLMLKRLETDHIADVTGRMPLVLLDDVLGELDESRQAKTLLEFSDFQTIITSTQLLATGAADVIDLSPVQENR